MVLSYAFCNVPVMPVKAEPRHRAEMVNQALFGEKAEVLEIDGNEWARVRLEWDGDTGWCRASQLTHISKKEYCKEVKYITNKHHNKLIFEDGEQWLPMAADLFGLKHLHKKPGKFKGKKLAVKELQPTPGNIAEAGLQYLNAPYLWGGRTIAGIDCSGLSQIAYKMCGIALPRNSYQQAEKGELVDFLQHARRGDLAFFDNEEGKIHHVGILLSDHTILHATDTSGRVVIDKIDGGGIISHILRRRTHHLRMIKRYF